MRDEIIQLNYERNLRVGDENVIIYKDIPLRLLKKRNVYKPLTNLLRINNIIYRWDRLEGVSFKYNSEIYRINTTMKLRDFIKKHGKDLEKRGKKDGEDSEKLKKDRTTREEEGEKTEETDELITLIT